MASEKKIGFTHSADSPKRITRGQSFQPTSSTKVNDIKVEDTIVSNESLEDEEEVPVAPSNKDGGDYVHQIQDSQPSIFCDSNIISNEPPRLEVLDRKLEPEIAEHLVESAEVDVGAGFRARTFNPQKNEQHRVKLAMKPYAVGVLHLNRLFQDAYNRKNKDEDEQLVRTQQSRKKKKSIDIESLHNEPIKSRNGGKTCNFCRSTHINALENSTCRGSIRDYTEVASLSKYINLLRTSTNVSRSPKQRQSTKKKVRRHINVTYNSFDGRFESSEFLPVIKEPKKHSHKPRSRQRSPNIMTTSWTMTNDQSKNVQKMLKNPGSAVQDSIMSSSVKREVIVNKFERLKPVTPMGVISGAGCGLEYERVPQRKSKMRQTTNF